MGKKIANIIVAISIYAICIVLIAGNYGEMKSYRYEGLAIGIFAYALIEGILYFLFNKRQFLIVFWRLLLVLATGFLTYMWHNKNLLIVTSICCFVPLVLQAVTSLNRVESKNNYQQGMEFFFPVLMLLSAVTNKKIYFVIFAIVLIIYTTVGIIQWRIYGKRKKRLQKYVDEN